MTVMNINLNIFHLFSYFHPRSRRCIPLLLLRHLTSCLFILSKFNYEHNFMSCQTNTLKCFKANFICTKSRHKHTFFHMCSRHEQLSALIDIPSDDGQQPTCFKYREQKKIVLFLLWHFFDVLLWHTYAFFSHLVEMEKILKAVWASKEINFVGKFFSLTLIQALLYICDVWLLKWKIAPSHVFPQSFFI